MRIAIFSDNFYPEVSGVSDSIVVLARELATRGHTVRFYVPRYTPREYKHIHLPVHELNISEGVSVFRLPSFPYPSGTRQSRFAIPFGFSLRDVRSFHPDVIHTQSPFPVGLDALRARSILKIPLIGTHHTPITEFLRYSPVRGRWFANLGLRYVAWYYNHCDFVSSPSHTIIDEMRRYGFRKPAFAVSNPLNVKDFRPFDDKAALKQEAGLTGFALLYVGRLAAEKNIDLLMRAFAAIKRSIPEATLGLVGRGAAEDDMRALSAKLGVAESVHFFGFVDSAEKLARIYNASDLFAIVSTAETQSLVAMQAMACGVPVIGVRAWGLPEYIHPGENGVLIEPGDEQALTSTILRLAGDEKERARLGAGGRVFTENLSAARIAERWEGIYAEQIAKHET